MLTFHNVGKGDAKVDYTDRLSGVSDGAFRVTGTLAGGQTVVVTYRVQVKPYAEQGNHVLDNFLDPTGTTPPTDCVRYDPQCTQNPVPLPAVVGNTGTSRGGGPLAITGGDWRTGLMLAGLLLGAGSLLTHFGRRRKPRSA